MIDISVTDAPMWKLNNASWGLLSKNSSYGYGMAIGVVVFLFSFALSALVSLVTRREVTEILSAALGVSSNRIKVTGS